MIWVGRFKSLHSALRKPRFTGAPLEVHTWLRSEIRRDLTVGGLAHESDRWNPLRSRKGGVR